ncbi:MAG TPA: Hsp33 family molecular chaperone [Hyphomicrobiaceae bacterium]|nr:Hsp33 family molecular chaperone [Hyphomicrobiaceae bacterium]
MSDSERPVGAMAAGVDDIVLPFQTVRSRVTGRLVRLGETVDRILRRHDYPDGVSETLGEALALAALIGTGLKFEGRLILQTKSDGPLDFLVADFATPGALRGYASFDKARCGQVSGGGERALLGAGHLAMTIDPGGDMDRYQGLVALDNSTLTEAADTYFRQSEQLPTFIRLAVARERSGGGRECDSAWRWRAGGIMLQHVAHEGGRAAEDLAAAEERGAMLGEDDDHWRRVMILAATVEDHELVDPTLSPERLLYRLFHEEGVRVQEARPLREYCTCSRERVFGFLKRFGTAELADMHEADGSISVTCEFCSTRYVFDPAELE